MSTKLLHPQYHITTFGCQMNVSDSERIAAVLEGLGYVMTDSMDLADVLIINSCSIRQKAEDRVVGMGKKIMDIKLKNPDLQVILTGCMAKRDTRQIVNENNILSKDSDIYHQKLQKMMPWLNHIVEINHVHKLGQILGRNTAINVEEYLSISPSVKKSFIRWIPISTGCNKFCTYCIVPFSRGKEIYRPYDEIMNEIENAVKSDVKEIYLLGQNVNSWRGYKIPESTYIESSDPHRLLNKNLPDNMYNFADLLDHIGEYLDRLGKKIWLRFTSSHPYDIDEQLIDVIKKHHSIAKQFHFALQSGSDSVLKRMNRHYTASDFSEKCELIRIKIPNVGISTDIIVGFCGETEEEFLETCNVMEKLMFDQAFISEYSNRKGTVAARVYKDDVSLEIKRKRKEMINVILSKGNRIRNKSMLNTIQDVLVYKKNKSGYVGRTENSKDVKIQLEDGNNDLKIGDFVKIKITNYTDWSLVGEICQ